MSLPFDPQVPRTRCLPEVRDRRLALLGSPHVKPLPRLRDLKLRALTSYHPSPAVRAEWAAKWLAIPDEWSQVMEGR